MTLTYEGLYLKKGGNMDNKQSVWEQIDEEQQDYQYFKQYDNERLHLTLEAVRKEYIDKNKEV